MKNYNLRQFRKNDVKGRLKRKTVDRKCETTFCQGGLI